MTKEKAIEILKQRECCRECVVDGGDCNACDEAFKTAFKALEQQSSENYKDYIFPSTTSELSTSKDSWCDGDYENCDYRDNCSYADNCLECAEMGENDV